MGKYLKTSYQEFIHLSRYSRWIPSKNRRENWEETVSRYFNFFESFLNNNNNFTLDRKLRDRLEQAVLNLDIMPSMRCLMTAGKALERDNICGYNCAYLTIDKVSSFDETLYILMNGTGVGFSVERQYINKLPTIADDFYDSEVVIKVKDSKTGWAKSFKELLGMLWVGLVPKWDISKVRKQGTSLKTFGGRASGPEPLVDLFKFCIDVFKKAKSRKLNSIECHDIMCKIAEIVVVGGVRRSALISLSNLSDDRMRLAKSGQWWEIDPQRALANNSAVYTEKPSMAIFIEEWKSLHDSKSGERGIFNREAANRVASKNERRLVDGIEFGTNPCSEIILRPREFCNLSEVIVRENDSIETLKEKVKLATILGTFQSCLTNFKYLSKEWKKNCEEERLLGVSLTGIMDCKLTSNNNSSLKSTLVKLKEIVYETNSQYAYELNVNPSAAMTCVKPSGTVSQLVDSASGIHTRHSPFYIRTVRGDKKDPLTKLMLNKGFPYEDDLSNHNNVVFSFPVKISKNSIFRKDLNAISQLEIWKTYQEYWCDHKPSVTIAVKEDEWLDVGAWVYKNFNCVSGVSFLPFSDHSYRQAPYQDCTKEEYNYAFSSFPKNIDWSDLNKYELEDQTKSSREFACTGGACEIK